MRRRLPNTRQQIAFVIKLQMGTAKEKELTEARRRWIFLAHRMEDYGGEKKKGRHLQREER